MSLAWRVLVLLFFLGSLAMADPASLTVMANAPPRNLYRWQLLPGLLVQKPGDAVEVYKQATAALHAVEPDRDEYRGLALEVEKLRQTLLAKLDRKRVKELVAQFKKPLDLIAEAGRREHANWDQITENLRTKGIGTLLPGIQEVREFLPFLTLQARGYLLEDRPEEAVKVAATAFSLARQLNECPTLLTHLVGLACAQLATNILEDCIQHPKCPSLYGALSDLPRPLLSARLGYEGERIACRATVPGLSKILADPVGAGLDPDYGDKLVYLYRSLSDTAGPTDLHVLNRYLLGLAMQRKSAAAREALRAAGYDQKTIEKMPLLNASILHAVLQYEEKLGRIAAAAVLPYPQARVQFDEIARTVPLKRPRAGSPDDAAFPLARFLLPAGEKILLADLRLNRRLELLRVAEGLRQHAAQTGKWPDKLDEVKGVSLPNDPATGKPFAYLREDDVAILAAPLPKPGVDRSHILTLRLTLRKPEEKKP